MDIKMNNAKRVRIEDQDWWQKYSAFVRAQQPYVNPNMEGCGSCYYGSGSGSTGIRYYGSGSGSFFPRHAGSDHSASEAFGTKQEKKIVIPEEEAHQNPYKVYERSRFPGEGESSQTDELLGYGLGLI